MTQQDDLKAGHGRAGRHPSREDLDKGFRERLDRNDFPGMFGRMFDLYPAEFSDDALFELAEQMKDPDPASRDGNNPDIPAGFTYLGQFIDHDITLDLTSIGEKEADPHATQNFRTPALDLDAIYGLGPDGSRALYARDPAHFETNPPRFAGKQPGPKFEIGVTIGGGPGDIEDVFPNDLPRSPGGFAIIGDHRNDENLVVAQTHLALLKFHNKVCDQIVSGDIDLGGGKKGKDLSPADVFKEARRIVTWHYQHMVLYDFVERVSGKGIVDRILHDGRKFYRFKRSPFMPVEFSAAAYRFGHSMVREAYSHNRVFTGGGPGGIARLEQLFQFTGLSGIIIGTMAATQQGFVLPTFPSNWIIDWRRYHEVLDNNPQGVPLNATRTIDPFLVPALHTLPGEEKREANLAFRNLRRGRMLGLPSGQDIAGIMGIRNPVSDDQIVSGEDGKVAERHGMHKNTPLWYYILKEAEQLHKGKQLGPVGGTIVAEVFVGLVHGDRASFLWQKGKTWKPQLPCKEEGRFTMGDLLRYVDDINPLGDAPAVAPATATKASKKKDVAGAGT